MEQGQKEKKENAYQKYNNRDAQWQKIHFRGVQYEIYRGYCINQIIYGDSSDIRVGGRGPLNNPEFDEGLILHRINTNDESTVKLPWALKDLKLSRIFDHENIQGIQTIILPKSRYQFDHINVIQEVFQVTLRDVLSQLGQDHVRFFLYQILRALKYIHSAGVVHNHLHMQNTLINGNCDLKMVGFNCATHISQKVDELKDICKWNLPPERLLGCWQNQKASDVWSVGCIFAQMMKQDSRFFLSGEYFLIEAIIKLIKIPDIQTLDYFSSEQKEKLKLIKSEAPTQDQIQINFINAFPYAKPEAADLLKKMLAFDPRNRITVTEALAHPYMVDLHLEEDQPESQPLNMAEFQFLRYNLTEEQLKDILYEEILWHNFGDFREEFERKKKNKESLHLHIIKSTEEKRKS